MKATTVGAAAAALFGSLVAGSIHGHQAAHNALHQLKRDTLVNATCGCTTSIVTYYGQATLVLQSLTSTTTVSSTSYTTATVQATTSTPAGPFVSYFSTTGVYTIPATTVTLTAPTVITVPPSSTTSYPAGTYTQPVVTVTATETDYYYFCPFSSSAAPPPPSSAPPLTSSSAAPAPSSSQGSSSSAAPAPSSSQSSSSSAAPATSSSAAPIGGGGSGQWAITYSPYHPADGTCKNSDEVSSDISQIKAKGFSSVRIYSTDCSGLQNVGSACRANGMKLIIGVYISNTGLSAASEQVSDICSWAQWDLVEWINIGSEAYFNQWVTGSDLAGFIGSAKGQLQGAGYSGQISTAEPLGSWQDESFASAVIDVIDVCCGHLHPFFNAETSCDDAGDFVVSQLQILQGICSNKRVFNCETGWPHQGDSNGAAVPGPQEQTIAIKGIVEKQGSQAIMFDSWDSAWKGTGEYGVEPYWGSLDCYD